MDILNDVSQDNLLGAINVMRQSASPLVFGQISVSCNLGSSDEICTYRVEGEINVYGTFKAINLSRQIEKC